MTRPTTTPALRVLHDAGITHRVFTFHASSSDYGKEAAAAMCARLDITPSQIYKTLIIELSAETFSPHSPLAVAMVPVTSRLDLKKAAHACGYTRARMAPIKKAEQMTGYIAGGISPLGQRHNLTTCIDSSIVNWQKIYISGGKRGCDVEIFPSDLIELTSARVINIRET